MRSASAAKYNLSINCIVLTQKNALILWNGRISIGLLHATETEVLLLTYLELI